MTRVVITGLGAVTPLGNDTETFLNGIFNEEIGIKPITKFDATETGITVAGQVDLTQQNVLASVTHVSWICSHNTPSMRLIKHWKMLV